MIGQPVFWLASYPKSGNTWARIFLASYDTQGEVDPNHLPRRFTYSDVMPYFYQTVAPVPLTALSEQGVLALRYAAMTHVWSVERDWPVFVKTHCARGVLGGIDLIPAWMTYGAVYIIRDPRDVVVSFAHHTGNTIDGAIKIMKDDTALLVMEGDGYAAKVFSAAMSWGGNVDSWASFPVIRYEDMLEKPKEAFSTLIEAVGWKVDEKRLEKAIRASSFDRLRGLEDRNGFTEASKKGRFFRSGKSGVWRDVLTDYQATEIAEAFKPQMERYGYL